MRGRSFKPGNDTALSRALREGATVHIPDIEADPASSGVAQQWRKIGGYRTILAVPLMREGSVMGAGVLTRGAVRPFTDKQIELVQTFADQAVIAIENVRLFDEVQARTEELSESLRQQTATAEVLKTISRTAFDLQRVLATLLENAVRICGAKHGMIFRYDGECCRAAAAYDVPPGSLELWERNPIRPGRGTTVGRALLELRPVQIPARSVGTSVEMVLCVIPGGENLDPEPVAIPLTWRMARMLAEHLQLAATQAEVADSRKK
jgi:two-component system, NtrC family, sensor kinase